VPISTKGYPPFVPTIGAAGASTSPPAFRNHGGSDQEQWDLTLSAGGAESHSMGAVA